MATIAKPYTRAVYPAVRAVRKSAVLSGIVPDLAHLTSGGYHVSLEDLQRYGNLGDYSSRAKLDKAPPVTTAGRRNGCGIDISMNPTDMRSTYRAVEHVWKNRARDTRAKYLNAINVWDGVKTHYPQRFNFQTGTKTRANRSHEWHIHGDWPRVYVDDAYNAAAAARAARAMASTVIGQSHDAWLFQERLGPYAPKPPAPNPTPPAAGDDDMSPIISTHTVPAVYAYDTPDTAGLHVPDGVLVLPLPPVSHPQHSWGKNYRPPYVSLAGDHMTSPQTVRVAIHNGDTWTTALYQVTAGSRQNVTIPKVANLTAFNLVIGRVRPDGHDGDPSDVDGVIGVLVELLPKP